MAFEFRCGVMICAIWLACIPHTALCAEAAKTVPGDDPILAPSYSTAFSAAVDEIVNTEILSTNIPSVTVAVLKNGKVVHAGAYGLEHTKPDVVAKTSTSYLLDSLTKQFTAAGIMILVQQGKLQLDQPVKTYIPYAPKTWDKVTLRHLLSHTSGLPRDPKWGYPSIRSQAGNPDRLLRHHIFNQPLNAKPGEKYVYSNVGYAALGAILEKVSGEPYPTFMQNHIFGPLGMTSTTVDYRRGAVHEGARGYDYDSSKNHWVLNYDEDQPLAAGAIQSTALDMAKWDAALRTESILSTGSKREMWTPFLLNNKTSPSYGFGWAVGKLGNKQNVVWHSGGGWGFDTAFFRFLDSGVSVIVLTNLQFESDGPDHAVKLAQMIAAAFDPALNMSEDSQLPAVQGGAAAQAKVSADRAVALQTVPATGGTQNQDSHSNAKKPVPAATE